MIHSIILFVLIGAFGTAKINIKSSLAIILAIHISLLVNYCITIVKMNKIDIAVLRYSA